MLVLGCRVLDKLLQLLCKPMAGPLLNIRC